MNVNITDGSGSSVLAKVGQSSRRLYVEGVQEEERNLAAQSGDAYTSNTGDITLTSDSSSAVAYLKNNGDRDIVVVKTIFILGTSTGGTGDWTAQLYRNPTAGTIITGAVDFEILANRNFGSSNLPDGNFYKGAEGNTITDGQQYTNTIYGATGQRYVLDVGETIIGKGQSLGVILTPPTGNTSLLLNIAFEIYVDRTRE